MILLQVFPHPDAFKDPAPDDAAVFDLITESQIETRCDRSALDLRRSISQLADPGFRFQDNLPAQSADMVSQISLIYDGEKDEKNPWFIDYGGDMTLEPVTEEKWNEMLGRFGEIRKIEWIPLKDWKK